MELKFVSESKIDRMTDGPVDEFEDDSPEARRWEMLREQVCRHLLQYSHEEDAEGTDGSPGFLLQDDHDNTKTLGMEFNAPGLMNQELLLGLAELLTRLDDSFQISITVFVNGTMQCLVMRRGVVYVPNLDVLKSLLAR